MTASARNYLRDRFREDADALNARALALEGGALPAGPDAATSRRMAAACTDVVTLLETIPDALEAIVSLLPPLEHRAALETISSPVRAVYLGAATRIREIALAETRAARSDGDDGSNQTYAGLDT